MNSGSAVKSNLGSATMVIQVLAQQEKENIFIEAGEEVGQATVNIEYIFFFSSAESLAGKKRNISSSYWSPP